MFDAELDGWEQTTLGAVAALGGGTTPSKSEDGYWSGGSVPWATPSDITSLPSGKYRIRATEVAVTDRALKECSLPLNPPGTVLMTSRATIGYAALNEVPMATNQGFITFRCGEKTDPEFLLHWLTAKRDFLVAAAGGSTFKELSRGTAKLLPIRLPPLDEQRRIAEVLRSVDEAVSTAQAVHDQSLTVKQRIIDDLCYGAGEEATLEQEALPDNWQMVQLGMVMAGVRYGTSAKCDASPQEGLPVLRIPNVVKGRVDFNDLKFAAVSAADARRFELQDGDIVLVRTNGNPAYIGRNALIADVSSPLLFASYLIRLRCDHDAASAAFIHAIFNSTRVRSSLLRSATTSAGNYNINTESLRALAIPLPPLPEQRRIADTISALSATCDLHEHDLWQKRYLRKNLASDLLSGRVRVRVPA